MTKHASPRTRAFYHLTYVLTRGGPTNPTDQKGPSTASATSKIIQSPPHPHAPPCPLAHPGRTSLKYAPLSRNLTGVLYWCILLRQRRKNAASTLPQRCTNVVNLLRKRLPQHCPDKRAHVKAGLKRVVRTPCDAKKRLTAKYRNCVCCAQPCGPF